ncbi:growth hormone secretagogue receptor type 1-like [Oncorhynchus tshawytscha]|uniref:G-protein coupled receptors family 1 profile domain-containing protein n=1 Tax=Oncorhynchus tshawytscha TaxID=74940 RepID=A0AAZ3RF98_ONCTS|nr:growth hormone secretagogue receptor type 1-like [Oncorhynchus tshawytscha]XP_042163452.1 growth hormone secretagogue receptor type 1-like [Oncorhynchus tshawytscha]
MDVSALGSGSSCSEDCVLGSGCLEDCGNQSDQTDWEWEDFSGAELVCVTAVCVLLLALGIAGNMLTILVVWLRPHLRSTTYLYLSSMAVSDLLMLLLMPLDLYYKLWRFRPWDLGDAVCKLSVFISESCTYSSILHITALSLERYLAVCRPLTAKTLVTRTRVRTLIGCLWVVAVISAGPVFAIVGVEELGGGEGESECRCTDYAVSSGLLGVMMWLSNLYFLVPLGILGVVYGLIGRKLWLRPQRSSRDRAQRHTIKMLGMIVLAFVLCWLPFHVGRTLFSVTLGSSADMYYISQYFNLVSFVLFYLSAAVNPILYNTMSARYRHAVRSLLRSHTPRSHHPPLTPQHSTTTL